MSLCPDATPRSFVSAMLLVASIAIFGPTALGAQDADPLPTKKDSTLRFPNTTAGELTPGSGFDLVKTSMGSLNVSVYGLFRYINQMPAGQTFRDHLGRERTINTRNDLNWHRTMIWLSGFFFDPRLRYTITGWSLATTQQTLLFGNLMYRASDMLTIGVGIAPTLTARSLQGSWPYWPSSDRQMGEEFFRGGFSSGVWITGDILPRLAYNLTINNNLSQLGTTQPNDTRDLVYGASLRWQPTTGEFGPRNGFGDFEHHTKVATQFGISAANSRESRYAPLGQPPNATQIKLSDGINPFDEDALAEGVTVTNLDYQVVALDAGAKYRGFSFQGEYYFRRLDNFGATGPLPRAAIDDHGFMVQAMHMVLPKKLGIYGVGGYVYDEFRRRPWEAGGGVNFYPSGTRSWRINLHLLHVERSPAGSSFGFYLGGLTGTVFSIGTDIIL